MRFGSVAIVGRSNVGKSTLLNALLGQPLAIVSLRPQTTRDPLLGVVHTEHAQILFIDTPGLHRPKNELGRRMNHAAHEAARGADVLVFMTDVSSIGASTEPGAEDLELIRALPTGAPSLLVINKVDLLRNKSALLPVIEAFCKVHPFRAVVPTSLLDPRDARRALSEITELLPLGEPGFPEQMLTDRPTSFFVREYVREQVLCHVGREVPHAVAVSIDRIAQTPRRLIAECTIHVEKPGQRKILVGSGGEMIKKIGIAARGRLEQLLEEKVVLELFVRVTPHWRNAGRLLAELGYEPRGGERRPRRRIRPRRPRRSQA